MSTHLHIFYSHSWITQLVIEAFIKREEIPIEDIVILSNRNFYQSIDQDVLACFVNIRKINFPNWMHAILSFNKLKRFDQWVNKISSGRMFILYVPHFHPVEVKVLVQNKNCTSVYLIEEGELSYRTEGYINSHEIHNHNLLRKKYFNFFWDYKLFRVLEFKTINHNIISGTLQMFKEAFPYSENKIVLLDDIHKLVKNNLPSLGNIENILVLTPYVDNLNLEPEIYFKDLERVMKYIVENTENIVYYKFHPNDSECVRRRTTQLATKFGNKFVQLSDNISIETILLKSKPTIYAFISSISLYAYLLDCKLNIMSDFIKIKRPNLIINNINLNSYVIQSNKF